MILAGSKRIEEQEWLPRHVSRFFQSISIQTLCMRFVSLLDPSSRDDFMGHHRLLAIGKALLK